MSEWSEMRNITTSGGNSVSISNDGSVIAVGYPATSKTQIYRLDGDTWSQLGLDIDGQQGDVSGHSVSLSADGTIVAIGAPVINQEQGCTRIYQYKNNTWTQLGDDINGSTSAEQSGYSVSLNVSDSNSIRIAIGAPFKNMNVGAVKIYQYNESQQWEQIGNALVGSGDEQYGFSVSLSNNGNTIAIGAPLGGFSGTTRIYEYNQSQSQSEWQIIGSAITGVEFNEQHGYSVSLNDDGTIVAIGSPFRTINNELESGAVSIYQYNNNVWTQLGDISHVGGGNGGYSVALSGTGTRLAIGAPIMNLMSMEYKYSVNSGNEIIVDIPRVGYSNLSSLLSALQIKANQLYNDDISYLGVHNTWVYDNDKVQLKVYQSGTAPPAFDTKWIWDNPSLITLGSKAISTNGAYGVAITGLMNEEIPLVSNRFQGQINTLNTFHINAVSEIGTIIWGMSIFAGNYILKTLGASNTTTITTSNITAATGDIFMLEKMGKNARLTVSNNGTLKGSVEMELHDQALEYQHLKYQFIIFASTSSVSLTECSCITIDTNQLNVNASVTFKDDGLPEYLGFSQIPYNFGAEAGPGILSGPTTPSGVYPIGTVTGSGRSYIYEYTNNVWEIKKVFNSTITNKRLGYSIALNNDGSGVVIGTDNQGAILYNESPSIPIGNICFVSGTPVLTDQGDIPIERIVSGYHTIRNKAIVAVTQNIYASDKYLVCLEKDCLYNNVPSQKTIISMRHMILYAGGMITATELVGRIKGATHIAYQGEILYNILMESYDRILVNNLICETLDPNSDIAKLYRTFKQIDKKTRKEVIKWYNAEYKKNRIFAPIS